MLLNKDQILKVSGRVFKLLKVPELGDDAELRLTGLTAGRALAYNALNERKAKGEDVEREMMTRFVEGTIVDANGDPLFDAKGAGEFIDAISFETLMLILSSAPGFDAAVKLGNSKASPDVA